MVGTALSASGKNSFFSRQSWFHIFHVVGWLLVWINNVHVAHGQVRAIGMDSCAGKCNARATVEEWTCQCDHLCSHYGDCCADYHAACLSCARRCDASYNRNLPCQCHWSCELLGNCCQDHLADEYTCGLPAEWTNITVTDEELATLSEDLLKADQNNYGSMVQVNVQGVSDCANPIEGDCATDPFFAAKVSDEFLSLPTVRTLIQLFDNYNPDLGVADQFTDQNVAEVGAFLDAVLETDVFLTLISFLQTKRMITSAVELKHALVSMWFSPFCRSSNQVDALSNDEPDVGDLSETQHVPDAAACSVLGSSGFEHVFMAEGRPHGGGFIGLHNWIFLYLGEFDEDINYLGHQAKASLPFKKGHLIEVNAVWKNLNKRSPSSIFVGASPEFELALFSLCFYARQDQHCPISLAGKRMNVTTVAVQDSEGKRLISTAFVVVPSWNNPG